jgi:outer membrane protein assembly factor BamB
MSYRITILLALFFLTGCETLNSLMGEEAEDFDPPAELTEFEESLKVTELWARNTGKGTDEQYLLLQPVVASDRIFIADTDRKVLALNIENGRTIWSYTLEMGGGFFSKADKVYITGGPGYSGEMVFIGTNNGDVIALDPQTGEELWKSKVSSEILAPPIKSGDIVIVRTLDGRIFGLNATSGRRLWTYEKTVPALTLRGTSTPAIDDDVIIIGFDSGSLAALDITTGRLLWETGISSARGRSELERMVDIDASPVISGGIVYVVTFQGQLAALTRDTGRILWNRDTSSYSGFSIDGDYLYITDDHSVIWAFDRFNGGSIWKMEGLLNRDVTAPSPVGSYLVVGDFNGYLHWLDKTTGTFVARQKISSDRIIAPPVTAGNVVYAFASDGELAALTFE